VKVRVFFIAICAVFTLGITGPARAAEQGMSSSGLQPGADRTCPDVGRFQLFQGSYKTFDLRSQQGDTSIGVFLLDTRTGLVKRYLNKIDQEGRYIETWIPTEFQTEKK